MERIKACNGSEKQSETYELILIGGDSGEYRLWEYEGLVWFLFEVCYRLGGARLRSLHQVNPRLIFVHRVQHQLEIVTSRSEDSQRVVSLSTRLKINDRTAFKSNESLLPLPSRNLRVSLRLTPLDWHRFDRIRCTDSSRFSSSPRSVPFFVSRPSSIRLSPRETIDGRYERISTGEKAYELGALCWSRTFPAYHSKESLCLRPAPCNILNTK